MTKEQFANALRELRLPPSSKLAARLLGINNRQIFYVLAGHCRVARSVENLLGLLRELDRGGVPPAEALRLIERRFPKPVPGISASPIA
jgi:hypothetical protein